MLNDATTLSVVSLVLIAILSPLIARQGRSTLILVAAPFLYVIVALIALGVAADDSVRPSAGLNGFLWNASDVPTGAALLMIAAASLIVGIAMALLWRALAQHPQGSPTAGPLLLSPKPTSVAPALVRWITVLATVSYFVFYGPANFLYRPAYFAQSAFGDGTLVGPIQLAAMLLASYMSFTARRGDRILGRWLVAIIAVLLFATASRSLAFLPLFLVAMAAIQGWKLRAVPLTIAAISAYIFVGIATFTRGSSIGHGLAAYVPLIASDPFKAFRESILAPAVNVASAAPIISLTQMSGRFGDDDLQISLDPLFGSSEWRSIAHELRIHDFIPYSAIGELATLSVAAVVISFFVLGVLSSVTTVTAERAFGSMGALVCGALVLYTCTLMMQYNLRSASRFAYVIVAMLVVALIVLNFQRSRQSRRALRPHRRR